MPSSLDRRLVEAVRRDLQKVRTVLMTISPFLSSLVVKARIAVSTSIRTARATPSYLIVINPHYWSTLSDCEKVFLVAHEVLHLAFSDARREGDRNHSAWNIICDAVNNELLSTMMKLPLDAVTLYSVERTLSVICGRWISIDRAISKEQLYRLVERCGVDNFLKAFGCRELDLADEPGDYEVIQSGSPEIYESDDLKVVEEKWRRAVYDALMGAKAMGKLPEGAERIIESLMPPSVRWEALLSQLIKEGLGLNIVSTYTRLSRKSPLYPGLKRLATPRVWALVDTSGSISVDELRQFVSEVYAIAKGESEVIVVPWDAAAYGRIHVRKPRDIEKVKRGGLKGGGGTRILPALRSIEEDFKPNDLLVILSDFDIEDWSSSDVQSTLRKLTQRSSVTVLATTHRHPAPLPPRACVVRVAF